MAIFFLGLDPVSNDGISDHTLLKMGVLGLSLNSILRNTRKYCHGPTPIAQRFHKTFRPGRRYEWLLMAGVKIRKTKARLLAIDALSHHTVFFMDYKSIAGSEPGKQRAGIDDITISYGL